MFSELPKLFERNFAIACFLPMTALAGLNLLLFQAYNLNIKFFTFATTDILVGTTIIGLLCWLGGIILLAMNRAFYRFFEGYGALNPLKLLGWIEKYRFKKTLQKIQELDEQYLGFVEKKKDVPHVLISKRNHIKREFAERFPAEENLVLPTPFGNTIRAFEYYPKIMYGIDAVFSWNRLLSVVPKDFQSLIDDSKTEVDFWVNMSFISLFIIFEQIILWINSGILKGFLLLPLALIIFVLSSSRSRSSAVEWGDMVKACFDVYLPKLREQLEFIPPKNGDEEQKMWREFSQAVIYRYPSLIPKKIRASAKIKRSRSNES